MEEDSKEYEQFEETNFDKDCIAKLKEAEDDSLHSKTQVEIEFSKEGEAE